MPAKYAREFSSIRTIPSAPEFHRFSSRSAATGRKRKVAGYTAGRELHPTLKILLLGYGFSCYSSTERLIFTPLRFPASPQLSAI